MLPNFYILTRHQATTEHFYDLSRHVTTSDRPRRNSMSSDVQLGGEEPIQEQNHSCMLLSSEAVDGPKDDSTDISDIALPYEFKIPDFILNMKSSLPYQQKPPPYPFPLPDIRLSAKLLHPDLQVDPTQFNLHDFTPRNMKGIGRERRPRGFHQDRLYDGFFDIGKKQTEKMEAARASGAETWRYEGILKVVEHFFRVDYTSLASGTNGTVLEEALQLASGFEEISTGKSYLALDANGVPLVALFASAYEKAWGPVMGRQIVKTTTENIDCVIRFVQPSLPKDRRRHGKFYDWIRESEGQPWATGPAARSGIFYFGMWKEMGHNDNHAVLTKDMHSRGAYAIRMIHELQAWCANITQTIDTCFAAVDKKTRDEYRAAYQEIPTGIQKASQTMDKDLFPFRALLINLLTEPHMDQKDWQGGWAWLSPFGEFEGALMCVTLLRRKFNFQPGSVLGIRGDRLEHFTTKWHGTNRYSWVFSFHETVRERGG